MGSVAARLTPNAHVDIKALGTWLTRRRKKRTAEAILIKVQQGGVKQSSRSHSGSGEPEQSRIYPKEFNDPLI
jgi:hypothetical protein